jgi:hypothetical protein
MGPPSRYKAGEAFDLTGLRLTPTSAGGRSYSPVRSSVFAVGAFFCTDSMPCLAADLVVYCQLQGYR